MKSEGISIVTVIGARPQFIKAATVSRIIAARNDMTEILVHTGQHYDANMSDIFFEEMQIPKPDYHLGIGGGGHGVMTGATLQALEPLLEAVQPDWVLVYGDTNSTLAGALAAAKLHIPVAHVEAGLRSFDRRMPEEQNRVVTDHLADLLFTPTDTASAHLRQEGIQVERIHQVGDVMYDATLYYGSRADEESHVLAHLGLERKSYVLATVHRAENTDDVARLQSMIAGLDQVAKLDFPVVLPLHPRTRSAMSREAIEPEALQLIEPVGYLDMVALERHAAVIATDSGGVQKEAYFCGVPCVTMRDQTEWGELVELGWNRLAPPGRVDLAGMILEAVGSFGRWEEVYGNGNAAAAVTDALIGMNGLSGAP